MSRRCITWYLVFAMVLIGIVPRVDASFAPSIPADFSQTTRQTDLETVQTVLESKMVAQRLKDLGFSHEEIRARLDQLSDQELHQLALKLDDLRVGQDAFGVIIALLVIAILVVVLLHLTGHRVIPTR